MKPCSNIYSGKKILYLFLFMGKKPGISKKNCIKSLSIKTNIRKNNPSIFEFNKNSSFIYEPRLSLGLYKIIKNNNSIKPNSIEEEILSKQLLKQTHTSISNNIIYISTELRDILKNTIKIIPKKNEKDLLIENIIYSYSKTGHISIRKIKEEYDKIAQLKGFKSISSTQIYRIIKNKLGLSYRKTIIKNSQLISNTYIKYEYYFLKVFLRGLTFGLNPIFIDECGFTTHNKNFYTWRKANEIKYAQADDRKKINLIMAVSNRKINHYLLTYENVNNKIFKKFIIDLAENMDENEQKASIIIMDNMASHLTSDMFEIYNKYKLKILFNVPYKSMWNMIELVFRTIKNITYKKLYNNIKYLENDINNIIKSGKIEESLFSLYQETLTHYSNFIDDYRYYNLNK